MTSSNRDTKEHDLVAHVCVDYEIDGVPNGAEPKSLVESIFSDSGASFFDHQLPVVASFEDPAVAVEASIVGQWRVQREINDPHRKLRIGVHLGDLGEAIVVMKCANGNQIVFSGTVDLATNGTLDARPMGVLQLATGPTQLWLSTDSRPDIDGRPLRIPT
ncbi:MAG: hypothetical protein ACJZ57_07720 [Candidatus Poriferisodalaceae bacterium]